VAEVARATLDRTGGEVEVSYDPREHGAQCDRCFLLNRREGDPVPPEINEEATAMIVAEAPGRTECQYGRPLIGDSGQELQRAISAMGYRRADFSYTNAILCRPPGNELGRLLNHLKNENKTRKAEYGKDSQLPSPMVCCRPRLLRELATFENIITLGSVPVQSITGTDHKVMSIRGGPIEGWLDETDFVVDELGATSAMHAVKILPTIHPSFVLRQRKWTKTFRVDIGRAMRWFTRSLGWVEPEVILHPTVAQIEQFLFHSSPRWFSWDLETTREVSPTIAKIFCIGVAYRDKNGRRHAMVVPFHSKEEPIIQGAWGHPNFYSTGEFREIVDLFKRWFVDRRWFKIGHNADIYDCQVVEAVFGVTPAPRHDTLPMHRASESELPHGLGFVGTTLTDVTAWKADNSRLDAKTDLELHKYNAIDCVVTDDIVEPLAESVKLREQKEVVKGDYRFLDACRGMHRIGMLVDPKKRDEYDAYFLKELLKWREISRQVVGVASFNPGSVDQVKSILFDRWGLPPVAISETTGEPSTDDDTLRAYRISYNLTRQQLQFIEALRRYRNAVKMRGTDIVKYRKWNEGLPPDELWEDIEEIEEDAKWRKKKDLKKRGILLADGRVHAAWNQLTTSGRANCTSPNLQNKRRKYRDMYIPEPMCSYCKEPHVFVAGDMDQLELRFGANRWNLSRYLGVFAEGRDPHAETAMAVFGQAARLVYARAEIWAKEQKGRKPKDHPDWKRMRDFAKRFFYACVARGTKVATLDAQGWKAIEDVGPGDWTYSWNGTGYEPARIIAAKCMGTKLTYRLTCFDGLGRRKTIEATGDHLFILRDGTSKRLDALCAGDRLMPFRRGMLCHGKYRGVDASNNGRIVYEHRVVCPGYPFVHHIDENGVNNAPDNLEGCASKKAHMDHHPDRPVSEEGLKARSEKMKRHWAENHEEYNARLSEGRRRSEVWREAARKNAAKARKAREENHKVERVELIGEQEVWDLTVDHPAHNFAIYDGVFVHNCQYKAEDETVYDVITSVEDDDGNLIYADVSMDTTRERRSNLLEANPEFQSGWQWEIDTWRRQGFLLEPVRGRRRDFLNGEEPNEIVNFPIQAGGRAVVLNAIDAAVEAIPFEKWCPKTGLVHDGHDSLMFEVPLSLGEWAKNILNECMGQKVPGHDVPYTAEARVGINKDPSKGPVGRRSWADV
jgi:DNA polymerase I-like protein with 3'-5' exonuclease and polymerase domains/uracil-DNA glycosylase